MELGSLSMMDFPSSYKKSLMQSVRDVVSSNEGCPCAFACIQAANEWLALEMWRDINVSMTNSHHSDLLVSEDIKSNSSSLNLSSDKVTVTSAPRTLIKEVNSGWRQKSEAEIEIEDKREEEYVGLATTEACQCAATLMRKRSGDPNKDDVAIRDTDIDEDIDEDSASAPSASARGLWSYTVRYLIL